MRFSTILVLIPLVAALVPEPATGANNPGILARAPLDGCDYNGCECDSVRTRKPQGQFCGTCQWSNGDYVITKKRVNSHVYECNPKGKCCDYGYAKDCAKMNAQERCG